MSIDKNFESAIRKLFPAVPLNKYASGERTYHSLSAEQYYAVWKAAKSEQPVGITDHQICDIVAIFNNPESPKIKCEECGGTGHIDVEDDDGYKGRCDECDGYGYYHMAVNQAERVRQVREHVLNGASPARESGDLVTSVEKCRSINMGLTTTIWNLIKSAEVLLDQPECKNATYNGNAFMATAVDSLRDSIAAARVVKSTTDIEVEASNA